VRALLGDHAFFQHDYFIRIADGAQPVCAMVSTVRPFINRSRASMTSLSDSVSRAAVGSSRIRMGLLRMIAHAMPIRCRWIPYLPIRMRQQAQIQRLGWDRTSSAQPIMARLKPCSSCREFSCSLFSYL
jgi:hypothetical protein